MPLPQRPLYALILRIGGIALISATFMLVKYTGEGGIALPEIMFWRQALSIPVLLGWLGLTGGIDQLRTRRLGTHARRSAVGMTGMLCNFGAAILLPLAVSTTLTFTSPIFAVILSALFLRERVGPWRWSAVAVGFAGVLVIAQPTHAPVSMLGAAAGLGAGLIVAVVSFQVRDLGRTESPAAIVFYFALFGALMMAPFLPFTMSAHDTGQWLMLAGIGTIGTFGQLLLTAALRHGAVSSVIVMDYTALIWAVLFGWLVWDQLPTLAIGLGAPAIVAAGLIVAWRERRLAKDVAPPGTAEID